MNDSTENLRCWCTSKSYLFEIPLSFSHKMYWIRAASLIFCMIQVVSKNYILFVVSFLTCCYHPPNSRLNFFPNIDSLDQHKILLNRFNYLAQAIPQIGSSFSSQNSVTYFYFESVISTSQIRWLRAFRVSLADPLIQKLVCINPIQFSIPCVLW